MANKKHSVFKALSMGFEKILDERGYDNGAYYVKDGKIWIFDIVALKQKLGISSNEELEAQDYDVETYLSLEKEPNELAALYEDMAVEDGEAVYLEGGMYLYPDGSIR